MMEELNQEERLGETIHDHVSERLVKEYECEDCGGRVMVDSMTLITVNCNACGHRHSIEMLEKYHDVVERWIY